MLCTIHYKGVRGHLPASWIRRIVRAAFDAAHHTTSGVVAIVFTDNRTMRRLNRRYRGYDKVTDVLSFKAESGEIGDIIVALPFVRRNAVREGRTFREAVAARVVHGVLHALGYDHERPVDARRMFMIEDTALRHLRTRSS